jgi:hypothetical protein
MEGFSPQGNVCSKIISLNLGNLIEEQHAYVCDKKITEWFWQNKGFK